MSIITPNDGSSERGRREREASSWVIKQFRGLSADEQDALIDWLAADPENERCLAECKAVWKNLDLLAELRPVPGNKPNPDLLDRAVLPRRGKTAKQSPWGWALAACVVLGLILWGTIATSSSPEMRRLADGVAAQGYQRHKLPDGSVVELNHGAQASVYLDGETRWVELERGEAHFTVVKDERPFVVTAGGVVVQAVGTAFNVRIGDDAVDVLVTEGHVKVGASNLEKAGRQLVEAESLLAELYAGHRSAVGISPRTPAADVIPVTSEDIKRELSWMEELLDFRDAPLSLIVKEFNRRNHRKLVIGDPAIGDLKLTAAIRPHNIDGLIELLELTTAVRAQKKDDTLVVLSR